MKKYIPSSSRVFIICTFVFAVVGAALLAIYSKGELLLALNSVATKPLDEFFRLFTHLGLGGVLGILAGIFLFIRYYYSILFAASLLSAGIFTYLLKQVIFQGMPRPTKFLGVDSLHHIIEGFKYHGSGSFPSGHTMTAFAGAFAVTIVLKSKRAGFIAFGIAFLVGISRVYLCQHFFMDIYAGALIGTAYTLGLHYWLGHHLGWDTNPKFNGNLISTIKAKRLKAS
ncbi:phosphatase PAP2 family protein [Labilibacter marinus]|uniref:phosphatase PAP2 family protein n=1 Tax=Labilibacter marinus TaxID=1477105 RepID=UPI00094F72BE|nr:phosphatase PAP2 family protein [Labilibacter marinus]